MDFYMQLKPMLKIDKSSISWGPTYVKPYISTHVTQFVPTKWVKQNFTQNQVRRQPSLACLVVGRALPEVRLAGWGFHMDGWPIFKVLHILEWSILPSKSLGFAKTHVLAARRHRHRADGDLWPACIWWLLIPDLSAQSPCSRVIPKKHKESNPSSLRASSCLKNV